MAQIVKNLPVMWDTQVPSLGWEDHLEKEMATATYQHGNSYISTHTHTHTHTIYTERKKVDTRKNFLTSICQNVVKAFLWEVHP